MRKQIMFRKRFGIPLSKKQKVWIRNVKKLIESESRDVQSPYISKMNELYRKIFPKAIIMIVPLNNNKKQLRKIFEKIDELEKQGYIVYIR